MKTRRKNDIAVGFREKEVKKIFELILAGESCSVVGIGSVGKSNLLRFLQQNNAHQTYLGSRGKNYLFVYVDGNKKLESTDWGLFELIFHQLYLASTKSNLDNDVLQLIENLYLQATVSLSLPMKFLILRFLDRAISMLVNRLDLNIVLLFDEFDTLCQAISPRAFSVLRAMRDDHKYKLVYVIATRSELTNLRRESTEIEAFYEIVTLNTLTLLSYSKIDALGMLDRLMTRYNVLLDKDTENTMIYLSGGHPALIRALFDVFRKNNSLKPNTVIENIRVQDECRRIWAGLSRQEQAALAYVASVKKASSVSAELRALLNRRGLLGGEWVKDNSIFSPIFRDFILKEQLIAGMQIIVDRDHHTVWVNGQKLSGLPPLEFRLIDYLEQHHGQDCSRDDIAIFLYPDEVGNKGEGVSDNRIDSIVKRVRKKIEVNLEKN
jgi:hypothetical protein